MVSDIVPEVAVTVVVPAFSRVATPVLLIVATDRSEEVHPTSGVRSRLVPSTKKPVAVNC